MEEVPDGRQQHDYKMFYWFIILRKYQLSCFDLVRIIAIMQNIAKKQEAFRNSIRRQEIEEYKKIRRRELLES